MTASHQIRMNAMPSTPPLLLRAALTRKSPGKQPRFPDTVVSVDDIAVSPQQLQRYREVCGFDPDSPYLPMSFLHVLAFRLQMSLMLQKDFPITPMGCIHLSNTLRQFRPVGINECPSLQCSTGPSKLTDKGVEFSFLCRAYIGQDKVWEDESRYLSRMKTGIAADDSAKPELRQFEDSELWQIRPEQARKYALASGDFNPIHLHNLSAKVLGFRQMIIHGMWSQAACIAALSDYQAERSECYAQFKTPIYLPARVQFCHQDNAQGVDFALRSRDGSRPHLDGYLRALK